MVRCSIITCKNYSGNVSKMDDDISYYFFPKDPARKVLWTEKTGRVDEWIPKKNSCVCSKHFAAGCFYITPKNQRRLLNNAIPTLFLPSWVMGKSVEEESVMEVQVQPFCSENISSNAEDNFYEIKNDDTPRERRLKYEIKRQRQLNEKRRKCIKRLQQKSRRNKIQIQSLKQILQSLEKNKLLNESELLALKVNVNRLLKSI